MKEKTISKYDSFIYLLKRITFFYKRNYFKIPVNSFDRKIISTIYYFINKFSKEIYGISPTKTQVYAIMLKVKQELKLPLPIGWYMYGPICIKPYYGDEIELVEFDSKTISLIKTITKDYCAYDNFSLQRKLIKDYDEKLYLVREELLNLNPQNKEKIYSILKSMITHCPKVAQDVVDDFIKATLSLGVEKTKIIFEVLWEYLALLRLKEDLRNYYADDVRYLDGKILKARKNVQIEIAKLIEHIPQDAQIIEVTTSMK